MQETKKIVCKPQEEQEKTELMQNFGWTLLSSQEINQSDTHLERRDKWGNVNKKGEGDLYSVTTTVNYINLLFARETTMKNYAKLAALEKEWTEKTNITESPQPAKPGYGIGTAILILIAGGILCAIFSWGIYALILAIILAAVIIALKVKNHKEAMSDYNAQIQAREDSEIRRKEIIKTCKSLLNS